MNSRLHRNIIPYGLFIFAIIGAISLLKTLQSSKYSKANRAAEPVKFAPDVDIPFIPDPTERLGLRGFGFDNTVICWPSIGGIIINHHISSVELDFLKLPRFETSPRSSDPSEEDEFCRQLRKTGGKWWEHYVDDVNDNNRPTSATEKEAIILGWPEDGGVWVLKATSWGGFGVEENGFWRFLNAHTMEERCKAMEMIGAMYYENPEDCDSVKELLDGFGDYKREEDKASA